MYSLCCGRGRNSDLAVRVLARGVGDLPAVLVLLTQGRLLHVCYQQEESAVLLSHGTAEGRDLLKILRPSDSALGKAVFWEMGDT